MEKIMSYEADQHSYLADVNRLWQEIQTLSLSGLTAEQTAAIKTYQRQNDDARNVLNRTFKSVLGAYAIADSVTKQKMEQDLSELRRNLKNAEIEFRKTSMSFRRQS
jgi:ABC-type branched-subunit amino acid transport system substrate-binding protein